MNIVASTADFRRAVTIATRVTERLTTIPILGGVRCRANGSLEVIGTDLDILMAVKVAREPGPDATFALLTPKEVARAVQSAGGKNVSIRPGNKSAEIVSGSLTVSAGTLPAEDFPVHLDRTFDQMFAATLSAEHLAGIARVAGAMADDQTRYYLNGIHLASVRQNTIRATATNGHQLYFVDLLAPDATGVLPDGGIIIPRKAVTELLALAKEATDGVRLTVGNGPRGNSDAVADPRRRDAPIVAISANLRDAEVRLVARCIDGTFPDCQRVVPNLSLRQAILPVAELRRAIRAISGHSKDDRAVRLDFSEPDRLTISAAYVSIGLSAKVEVPCQHDMRGLVIGFNGKYLGSIVAASGGDEVLIDVAGEANAALVRNPSDTEWTGVLMPMRVS